MVKFVAIVQPKEGSDPEEFWKYWLEVHAPRHINWPGLRKYCISRVTEVVGGDTDRMWGMAEEWFDDMESFIASRESDQADPEKKKAVEEWHSRLAWRSACIVEERVIVDR